MARAIFVDPSFQLFTVDPGGARVPLLDAVEVARRLREVSPLAHVSRDDPPTLFVHGAEDRLVPVEQTRRLHERLLAAGVASELVIRQGAEHACPGWEADSQGIARWFDGHLRPETATFPPANGR